MVEIDPANQIRYRLRVKDAPEPDILPDSEISSRLQLKQGRHHFVLVVEKSRDEIVFPAPPGEHSNYEALFHAAAEAQQAIAFLSLKLNPELNLKVPAKRDWYNPLDAYTIDLGEWDVKQEHKSLSVVGDMGKEAWKKHGQSRCEFETQNVRPLELIEVNLSFGLDVTS